MLSIINKASRSITQMVALGGATDSNGNPVGSMIIQDDPKLLVSFGSQVVALGYTGTFDIDTEGYNCITIVPDSALGTGTWSCRNYIDAAKSVLGSVIHGVNLTQSNSTPENGAFPAGHSIQFNPIGHNALQVDLVAAAQAETTFRWVLSNQ